LGDLIGQQGVSMTELIEVAAQGAVVGFALTVIIGLIKLFRVLFPGKPPEENAELREIKAKVDPQTLSEIEAMISDGVAQYNPWKAYLKTFIGIAVIISLIFILINSTDNPPTANDAAMTDEEVHELLKDISSQFAGTFPKTIDKDTTVTAVRADYRNLRTLIYYYRLESLNKDDWVAADLRILQERLKIPAINRFCSQPVMADFRDIGVSLEYNYSDKKDIYLFSNYMSVNDCN
jgi:hypothetical protein